MITLSCLWVRLQLPKFIDTVNAACCYTNLDILGNTCNDFLAVSWDEMRKSIPLPCVKVLKEYDQSFKENFLILNATDSFQWILKCIEVWFPNPPKHYYIWCIWLHITPNTYILISSICNYGNAIITRGLLKGNCFHCGIFLSKYFLI